MAPGHTSFAADGMVYRCGGHKSVAVAETMDTDGINPRLYVHVVARCKYCTRDLYEITRHGHRDHPWEDDKVWKKGITEVPAGIGKQLRAVYVKEKAAARKAYFAGVAKKAEELAQAAN